MTVPAANILWVSDHGTDNTFSDPGSFPDGGWITLLQGAGHNVNRYNGPNSQNTRLTADALAAMNTNDLIIVGRAVISTAFQNPQVIDWNVNLTKPVLTINAYLARANRLGWCTGNTMINGTPTPVTAVDLNDPETAYIFGTVAMNGDTTVNPYDEALLQNTSQILEGPVAGGTVLARASFTDLGGTVRNNIPIIIEWPAGTAVRAGADVLGSYRMYFAGGNREAATGGNVLAQCVENLTPTGEAMFIRAVEVALNNGIAPGDPSWPVGFRTQPQNVTVGERNPANFSCSVTGAVPITLQWERSDGFGGFTNVPGANGTGYILPAVTPADDGAQFRLFAQNPNNSVYSDTVTLTVITDVIAPYVVGVRDPGTFTNLIVSFSERIRITDSLNFQLFGDDNVYTGPGPYVDGTGTNVVLEITPMTLDGSYTLAVEALEDLAATPNPIEATNITVYAPVLSCGFIRGNYYFLPAGLGGTVDALTSNTNYPANVSVTRYYTNFNSQANFADNYGLRLWGFFVPPTNGNYTFYVRSDDSSQVWISPNEDPANRQLVALQNGANVEYTNTAGGTPRFGTLTDMVAGQRYYMEALLKEGTGGDYITVVAKAEGEPWPVSTNAATVNPIPAAWFCSYGDRNGVSIIITNEPLDATVLEVRPVSFTIGADINPADRRAAARYQWQKNDVDIPGANGLTYSIASADFADNGALIQCIITVPGLTVTSRVATLTVQRDFEPPRLLSAGSLNGWQIGLMFDERLNPENAIEVVNYVVNDYAAGVLSARLRPDGKSVILTLDAPVTAGFTVKTLYMQDLAPVPNEAEELVYTGGTVVRSSWISHDVGVPGDPIFTGSGFAGTNTSRVEVLAGGTDIWNASDGMHYVYETVTGDFDARVRVESLSYMDPATKCGLVVRESTNANSRHVAMLVMPPAPGRNIFVSQWRTDTGGGCASRHLENTPTAPTNRPAWPNAWLRLQRSGAVFTGSMSDNGTDWVELVTYTNAPFAGAQVVGLGATSHNNTSTNNYTTAVFSDYQIQQPGADLAVSKTASADLLPVNNNITYILTVTNQNADAANGVTLADTLPAGVTYLVSAATQGSCTHAGGVVTCNLGTLPAGGTAVVSITVRARTAGVQQNSATVSSFGAELTPEDNTATASTTVYSRPSVLGGSLVYSATGGTGGGASFSGDFESLPGLNYIVEYKDSLANPGWTFLITIPGDGSVKTFTDPGPLPASRFYQVRIEVP